MSKRPSCLTLDRAAQIFLRVLTATVLAAAAAIFAAALTNIDFDFQMFAPPVTNVVTATNLTHFNFAPPPAVVWVDDSWTGAVPGSDPDGGGPATNFGVDSFATVQGGVDGVADPGTVIVYAGTYNEGVTVNKSLLIDGSGQGSSPTDTIITNNLAVNVAANDVTLRDLRLDAGGGARAIQLGNITDLTLDSVTARNGSNGLRVGMGVVVNGLTVTNSHFDDNLNQGWYLAEDSASGGNVTNVNVTNSTFNNNVNKGIYAEKLDNAVFNGITVSNSGTGGPTNHRAGIDINLKWAAYSNIQILNSTITNNGKGGDNNSGGMLIKARSTGSYASPPASLTGVTLTGNTVLGNGDGTYSAGIRIGESNNSFTGIDAGPTGVVVSFSRIVGNAAHGLRNATASPNNVVAENNWWGCNYGPGTSGAGCPVAPNGSYGVVDADPWIVLATSALPNPTTPGGTSTATAAMNLNSNGADPAGVLPDIPVAWSATNGSMAPPSGTVTSDTANSTFTSANNSSGTACATVDNQEVCTNVNVTVPNFTISDVTANEGNAGNTAFTFAITRNGGTAFATSVTYQTNNGSAIAPGDYAAVGPTVLNFPASAGDSTQNVAVQVGGDIAFEPDETFTVDLSAPINATIGDASGLGTITNDDCLVQPSIVYVDDNWVGKVPGTDPDGGGPATNFGCDAFATIQGGIDGVDGGGDVYVATGTYSEAHANKAGIKIHGAGVDAAIIIGSHSSGSANTLLIDASGVLVEGFTITRSGNTSALWASNVKNQGVSISAPGTGSTLRNCKITGNRNGIYIGQSSDGNTIYRNIIDDNRTGIHVVDNNGSVITENYITNNWTMGFLYRSEGGAGPTGIDVHNNYIQGNWYSDIEFRGPATGGNMNFSGNYLGAAPTRVVTPSGEPGYAVQIPSHFPGGAATAPGSHPTIAGVESARVDYSPYLNNSGDTAPGTSGFQGDFSSLSVTPDGAHVPPPTSRIQEANDLMTGGSTLNIPAGTYPGDVNITKPIHVKGSFTVGGTFTLSHPAAQVSPGTSPGIINTGSLSLTPGSTVNIEINGPIVGSQYDQLNVTGTVSLGSATLNTTLGYTPTAGHTYTIINNDGGDAVTGTFAGLPEGTVFYEGADAFEISYAGGTGNDVVLTNVAPCNAVTISTGITTLTGVSVNVPINVDDTTGNGLYSTDFTLTYNPAVINAPVVSLGTVSAGSVLTVNGTTPGVLIISIFQSTPWTGAGTLANVSFTAVGLPGTSSPVTFSAFKFNEGTQCLTTSNGLVTIIGGTITGTVTYGNALSGPLPPRYVPNATINGSGPTPVSTTSSAVGCPIAPCGTYSLSGFVAGSYTRSASKTGGIPPVTITSFDSSRIAQHVVGLVPFIGPNQATVADVSGTGGVTSFDASLIARYVVALPGSGTTGNWVFTPTSYGPSTVYANITGEDYTALLMGDVTGNWDWPAAHPGGRMALGERPRLPTLTAPTMTARSGMAFTVPLRVANVVDQEVTSYQFNVRYDSTVIRPAADPIRLASTVSDGMVATVNAEEPGLLRVAVFSALPLTADGVLANLRFVAVGHAGTATSLVWEDALINEGTPGHRSVDGQISIIAGATDLDDTDLAGRLLTATGEPVAFAAVTITDSMGITHTSYSDKAGQFRFDGVQLGETYTVSVVADRYTFTPITVSVVDAVTLIDLIAQP